MKAEQTAFVELLSSALDGANVRDDVGEFLRENVSKLACDYDVEEPDDAAVLNNKIMAVAEWDRARDGELTQKNEAFLLRLFSQKF